MSNPPDATAWIPESSMLSLCEVSRSTLRSWIKSGLDFDLAIRRAAYGTSEVITLLIFAAARKHLSQKELVAAWKDLEEQGKTAAIVAAAERLRDGDRFELVLDLKYSMLEVVLDDEQLLTVIRGGGPRPLVVLDLAEPVRLTVAAFRRMANTTPRPSRRKAGRPASAPRQLRAVGDDS